MSDTVEGLWVFTHNIWTARCTTLHDMDRAESLQNTKQQLNDQITELYDTFDPDNYQREDHHLFMGQTLQQRLLMAKNNKYTWIHSVTWARKIALADQQSEHTQMRNTMDAWLNTALHCPLQIMDYFHSSHGLLHPQPRLHIR